MSESLECLLGNTAQDYVFKQLKFIVNRGDTKGPDSHLITQQATAHLDAFGTRKLHGHAAHEQEKWRAAANEKGKEGDTFVKPESKDAPPKGYLGMYELSILQPPEYGNCGEMALLAYRKIIKTALDSSFSIGVATVTVADVSEKVRGNHSFTILGTDLSFLNVLAGNPTQFDVSVLAPPSNWGTQVWICDPWIDGGKCRTFRITDADPKSKESRWTGFMRRTAKQAGCPVTSQALQDKDGNLRLTVHDSLIINDPVLRTGTLEAKPALLKDQKSS